MEPGSSTAALPTVSRPALILTQSQRLRFITFFYLYVMQGVPAGFATTALANYLAAEGLRADRIGTFVAMQGLPWTFQFIWGPFIDRYQGSRLGRRRPWVVVAQGMAFLASLSMLLVDDPASQVVLLGLTFLVHGTFASVQDASVDAMAISTIPATERGRTNAFMRGGFLLGTGLGAAGLAYMLRHQGFHAAVLAQSAFLLLFTVLTACIRERPTDALFPGHSTKQTDLALIQAHVHPTRWLFRELVRGLTDRSSLRWFLPILLVYSAQSIFIRAYNVHLIQQLGWSDTALSGLSGSYGVLIVIVVVLAGGTIADRFGARRILPYLIGFHFIYLLTINLLASYWSNSTVASAGSIIWNMMDPSLSVAAIPIIMSLCRTDVEGSQFTAYMAMINLADVVGAFLSGHAQRVATAPTIGLFSTAMVACSLLWITYLSRKQTTLPQNTTS
ncbi:MFS transporter [Fibrella forsythiae]|uniref:MFS transporter n=1 Tax=Fibrella forsythiae TaxID=2817061 RepID=A0ABS3JG08_9BACT|nr:MFS transporter [Fibrella forsythiae]MBO0948934.1 MFS transporter [Fibrella forsythiae]